MRMQETIRLPVNVVQELHKAKKELEKAGVELPDKDGESTLYN
jgi:hypothetical protein